MGFAYKSYPLLFRKHIENNSYNFLVSLYLSLYQYFFPVLQMYIYISIFLNICFYLVKIHFNIVCNWTIRYANKYWLPLFSIAFFTISLLWLFAFSNMIRWSLYLGSIYVSIKTLPFFLMLFRPFHKTFFLRILNC